ncbi:hypothetical protein D3C72_861410 [compost metagenome]
MPLNQVIRLRNGGRGALAGHRLTEWAAFNRAGRGNGTGIEIVVGAVAAIFAVIAHAAIVLIAIVALRLAILAAGGGRIIGGVALACLLTLLITGGHFGGQEIAVLVVKHRATHRITADDDITALRHEVEHTTVRSDQHCLLLVAITLLRTSLQRGDNRHQRDRQTQSCVKKLFHDSAIPCLFTDKHTAILTLL